jgi:hypothetical protein
MKTTKINSAIVLVFLFAVSVIAQQTENQLWYSLKHTVKPEKLDEYRELMKNFTSACKEHNYPFTFYGFKSLGPEFYYFYPVKDYNTIEELSSAAWEIVPKLEPDWASKFFGSLENWEGFFIRSIDSLSYNPENGPAIGEELVYAEWWVSYHKTLTARQYRNAFREGVERQKKANLEYPIGRFRGDIGMNNPVFITVFWGKNVADLYAHLNKIWENLGEEVQGMINDLESTTSKSKKIPFWYQKEFSYSSE